MKVIVNEQTLELVFEKDLVASNLDEQTKTIKDSLKENPDVKKVSLNFENVKELDSLGINLIIATYKEADQKKKDFYIFNTSTSIKNLFHLFKLHTYFEIS